MADYDGSRIKKMLFEISFINSQDYRYTNLTGEVLNKIFTGIQPEFQNFSHKPNTFIN